MKDSIPPSGWERVKVNMRLEVGESVMVRWHDGWREAVVVQPRTLNAKGYTVQRPSGGILEGISYRSIARKAEEK